MAVAHTPISYDPAVDSAHAAWAAVAESREAIHASVLLSCATIFIAVVALVVPFLMRWLDRAADRQKIALASMLACHHARGALLVIDQLQTARYEEQRTTISASTRQWDFELAVAEDTITHALKAEMHDPALLPNLCAVHAWTKRAREIVPMSAKDGLFQLQYSTEQRKATLDELLRLQKQFLMFSTSLFVRRRRSTGSSSKSVG